MMRTTTYLRQEKHCRVGERKNHHHKNLEEGEGGNYTILSGDKSTFEQRSFSSTTTDRLGESNANHTASTGYKNNNDEDTEKNTTRSNNKPLIINSRSLSRW